MIDEKMLVCSLLFRDVDDLKSVLRKSLDSYFDEYDNNRSISPKKLLDLISDVHMGLKDLVFLVQKGSKK